MSSTPSRPAGGSDGRPPAFTPAEIGSALEEVRSTAHVVREEGGRIGLGLGGELGPPAADAAGTFAHLATLPPLYPEWLGDRSFQEAHGVRFPYVTGAMANGIATTRLVVAMARANMLGFFGAAGLGFERVERSVNELSAELGVGVRPDGVEGELKWGVNLIHSPQEPALEAAVADLLVERGVARVEASAFMALTPSIVRYAASGLSRLADGSICRRHHVFAKVSRPEVAPPFMSPAPAAMLDALVREGKLTSSEAERGGGGGEADSGGHTDNRPAITLLPTMLALRDALQARHEYPQPLRVGLAGGIATPASAAAAFAMGAAYIMTGSINQACVEAGTSPAVRELLAAAEQADVMMAPAADMFEMGVKVQVLKRGTMFAMKARKLYDLYRAYNSLEALPPPVRAQLEKDFFRTTLEAAWESTKAFFAVRDPRQIERGEQDPHHRMALVFRSYLGQSSRWANAGVPDRRMDYQVWCGPAMGAFNEWTQGTFLAAAPARQAETVAMNILVGAAALTRAAQLRQQGVTLPAAAGQFAPRPMAELEELLTA